MIRELFQKCRVCKGTDEPMETVRAFGQYGAAGRRLYYHRRCVREAMGAPEKYTNAQVDAALNIVSLRADWDMMNSDDAKRRGKRIDELKDKLELI